jgi:hypothetical protein
MPSGGGLTGGWQTEHYSSPAHTMSRLGASGRRGGPIWVVVRDREVPEWWLDNGNDFGGSSGGGSSRERGRMDEELGGEGWSEPRRWGSFIGG